MRPLECTDEEAETACLYIGVPLSYSAPKPDRYADSPSMPVSPSNDVHVQVSFGAKCEVHITLDKPFCIIYWYVDYAID